MVGEEKRRALQKRMQALGIEEKDLEERFVRSRGHGGQNVNKVSSCVQLKHIPSGLEVKCQKSRSQADNRYFARVLLCNKLETKLKGEKSQAEQERYRIRKQKQRRSRRAKAKMVADKRVQSQKKQLRQKPELDEE